VWNGLQFSLSKRAGMVLRIGSISAAIDMTRVHAVTRPAGARDGHEPFR
jgi:hypothetical protein